MRKKNLTITRCLSVFVMGSLMMTGAALARPALAPEAEKALAAIKTEMSYLLTDKLHQLDQGVQHRFKEAFDTLSALVPDGMEIDEGAGFDEKLIVIARDRRQRRALYDEFWEKYGSPEAWARARKGNPRIVPPPPILEPQWYTDDKYRLIWEWYLLRPSSRLSYITVNRVASFNNTASMPIFIEYCRLTSDIANVEQSSEHDFSTMLKLTEAQKTQELCLGALLFYKTDESLRAMIESAAKIDALHTELAKRAGVGVDEYRYHGKNERNSYDIFDPVELVRDWIGRTRSLYGREAARKSELRRKGDAWLAKFDVGTLSPQGRSLFEKLLVEPPPTPADYVRDPQLYTPEVRRAFEKLGLKPPEKPKKESKADPKKDD